MHERFPDMVTEETVKEKWADYLKQKRDCKRCSREEKRGGKRSSTEGGKIGRGIKQHCFLAKSKKDKQQGT